MGQSGEYLTEYDVYTAVRGKRNVANTSQDYARLAAALRQFAPDQLYTALLQQHHLNLKSTMPYQVNTKFRSSTSVMHPGKYLMYGDMYGLYVREFGALTRSRTQVPVLQLSA